MPSHRDLHGKTIPQERFRVFSPLKLEPTEPDSTPIVDVNETLPVTLELTLEECRAMALQNNLELRATLVNPTIAAERVAEERARFEGVFGASASRSKGDKPSINAQSANEGTQTLSDRFNLNLSQPLFSGGTLGLDLNDSENTTNATVVDVDPNDGSFTIRSEESFFISNGAQFSFTQPLLRNAGTRTLTYSIRLASYQRQIVDAQTKLAVMSVLADVDRVYWRLYAARQELEVRKQQFELAQSQLQQAQRLVDSGERAPIEVLRAEAGIAERLEAIIIAQNSVSDRQRELKRLINRSGLGMQTLTMVMPETSPVPIRYAVDSEKLVATALANRMELLVLELEVLQDLDTIDFQKNQKLPLINFDYRYNVNAFGPNRDESYDSLVHNQFADHYFGLSMQIPLGNRAAQSRLRQAMLQRYQRLSTQKNREALITLEVLNAGEQLEANWQRIMASQQNTIVSGRLYEAEKRQFEQGQRTSTEVLDAQTNLANAQLAELSALVEYQIAQVDLAYATGTLLGSAQVEWEPLNAGLN